MHPPMFYRTVDIDKHAEEQHKKSCQLAAVRNENSVTNAMDGSDESDDEEIVETTAPRAASLVPAAAITPSRWNTDRVRKALTYLRKPETLTAETSKWVEARQCDNGAQFDCGNSPEPCDALAFENEMMYTMLVKWKKQHAHLPQWVKTGVTYSILQMVIFVQYMEVARTPNSSHSPGLANTLRMGFTINDFTSHQEVMSSKPYNADGASHPFPLQCQTTRMVAWDRVLGRNAHSTAKQALQYFCWHVEGWHYTPDKPKKCMQMAMLSHGMQGKSKIMEEVTIEGIPGNCKESTKRTKNSTNDGADHAQTNRMADEVPENEMYAKEGTEEQRAMLKRDSVKAQTVSHRATVGDTGVTSDVTYQRPPAQHLCSNAHTIKDEALATRYLIVRFFEKSVKANNRTISQRNSASGVEENARILDQWFVAGMQKHSWVVVTCLHMISLGIVRLDTRVADATRIAICSDIEREFKIQISTRDHERIQGFQEVFVADMVAHIVCSVRYGSRIAGEDYAQFTRPEELVLHVLRHCACVSQAAAFYACGLHLQHQINIENQLLLVFVTMLLPGFSDFLDINLPFQMDTNYAINPKYGDVDEWNAMDTCDVYAPDDNTKRIFTQICIPMERSEFIEKLVLVTSLKKETVERMVNMLESKTEKFVRRFGARLKDPRESIPAQWQLANDVRNKVQLPLLSFAEVSTEHNKNGNVRKAVEAVLIPVDTLKEALDRYMNSKQTRLTTTTVAETMGAGNKRQRDEHAEDTQSHYSIRMPKSMRDCNAQRVVEHTYSKICARYAQEEMVPTQRFVTMFPLANEPTLTAVGTVDSTDDRMPLIETTTEQTPTAMLGAVGFRDVVGSNPAPDGNIFMRIGDRCRFPAAVEFVNAQLDGGMVPFIIAKRHEVLGRDDIEKFKRWPELDEDECIFVKADPNTPVGDVMFTQHAHDRSLIPGTYPENMQFFGSLTKKQQENVKQTIPPKHYCPPYHCAVRQISGAYNLYLGKHSYDDQLTEAEHSRLLQRVPGLTSTQCETNEDAVAGSARKRSRQGDAHDMKGGSDMCGQDDDAHDTESGGDMCGQDDDAQSSDEGNDDSGSDSGENSE